MSNPTTVSSNITERAIISVPTQPWEQTPYGRAVTGNVRLSSNEGPEQLISPVTGQQFIVYSAARSDNPNYCLGLLALKQYDGADPMNAEDWVKTDGCVFYQNKLEGAYSVGHASFVKSPDGSEWFRKYSPLYTSARQIYCTRPQAWAESSRHSPGMFLDLWSIVPKHFNSC